MDISRKANGAYVLAARKKTPYSTFGLVLDGPFRIIGCHKALEIFPVYRTLANLVKGGSAIL